MANSGYHYLKQDRNLYILQCFHVDLVGTDLCDYHLVLNQWETCFRKIFKDQSKVFGITDDILIVGYDDNG